MSTSSTLIERKQIQHYPFVNLLSNIHGKGLFAQKSIPAQALIYESDDYDVTPNAVYGSIEHKPTRHILDKYLRLENHSCAPNTTLQFVGDIVQLISIREINENEELVCDYRTTEKSIPIPFQCNCGHCNGVKLS